MSLAANGSWVLSTSGAWHGSIMTPSPNRRSSWVSTSLTATRSMPNPTRSMVVCISTRTIRLTNYSSSSRRRRRTRSLTGSIRCVCRPSMPSKLRHPKSWAASRKKKHSSSTIRSSARWTRLTDLPVIDFKIKGQTNTLLLLPALTNQSKWSRQRTAQVANSC